MTGYTATRFHRERGNSESKTGQEHKLNSDNSETNCYAGL